MKNKVLIGILIISILITFLFFLKNRFSPSPSPVLSKMDTNAKIILFITEKDCSECKKVKKILKEENISFYEINKDLEKNYEDILRKGDLSKEEVIPPTLVYYNKKKKVATLVHGSKKDILDFIKNYQ